MEFNFRDSSYRSKFKAKGIAWRGKIGVDISDCKTTEEAIVKAKLDYTVAKCQLSAKMPAHDNGASRDGSIFPNVVNGFEFVDVPGEFATYRTDTNIPLGKVKSRYEVVQNQMAFGFFDDALGGRVKLDRAGYFGYGQKIFMSATFDKDINIGGKNDTIQHYFVFTNSHDGGSAVQMMITPVRVICMNALHSAKISAESYISFRHNKGVNGKILTVPEILGLTERKIEEEEDMYKVLFKTKVSDEEVKKYRTLYGDNEIKRTKKNSFFKLFLESLGDPMIKILLIVLALKFVFLFADNDWFETLEAAEISMQKLNTLCDTFEYYQEGVGQRQIAGTAYGAYNAVTGYFSNVKDYKTEELRLKNTVFEGDYNTSLKALNYALADVWE